MSFETHHYLVLNQQGNMVCKVQDTGPGYSVWSSKIIKLPVNGLIVTRIDKDVFDHIHEDPVNGFDIDEFLINTGNYFTK